MKPLTNFNIAFVSFVVSSVMTAAFHVSPRHVQKPFKASELSPIDEMCIENVAEFCLQEACDIEEYEALICQLEEQRMHFIKHVANVESLLIRLKDSNHPEYNPDEVKVLIENIKSVLRNPPPATIVSSD